MKQQINRTLVLLHPGACLWLIGAAMLSCLVCGPPALASQEEDAALWSALRSGGHVALLRHAIAPGMGDPPEFTLGSCRTQRNLSAEGRRQAARIGERFRANGIRQARVFSSQWCRCLETANLLELGSVQELAVLNSFFNDPGQREPQTELLRDWLNRQPPGHPLVLVTHQVNITALTNVYPGSGELVILRRSGTGGFAVVGTIRTD